MKSLWKSKIDHKNLANLLNLWYIFSKGFRYLDKGDMGSVGQTLMLYFPDFFNFSRIGNSRESSLISREFPGIH